MSEPLPRIVGLEDEFAIQTMTRRTNKLVAPESEMADIIISSALAAADFRAVKGGFLPNGARFYKDANARVEYATPECASFADAVYAQMAGERIILNGLQRLVQEKIASRYTLHARVIDEVGHTWGHHENYQITREAFGRRALRRSISAHLATRNLFVGAGLWRPTRENPARVLTGQKVLSVNVHTDYDTVSKKPLYNLRDEALGDKGRNARLHVVAGDNTISPWATWLALGTTSLVCRLTELHHIDAKAVTLKDVVRASKSVAYNPDALIELANGQMVRAVDIQEKLADQCVGLSKHHELPDEELTVLDEWREAIDDYRYNPEQLIGRTEWLARQRFLGQLANKYAGLERNALLEKLHRTDQLWDNLDPKKGIAVQQRRNMAFPDFKETGYLPLVRQPVDNTRAWLRGGLIAAATSPECVALFGSSLKKVTWECLYFLNDQEIQLPDSRAASNRYFNHILDAVGF